MAFEALRAVSRRRWLVVLGGLGAAAAAIRAFAPGVTEAAGFFSRGPGRFDRGTMQAIVEEVRRRGIARGEARRFHLRDLGEPATMSELAPDAEIRRGRGRGRIDARVTSAGALQVVIETADHGHAGEYGFAYSDAPLESTPMGGEGGWHTLHVPGHLFLTRPGNRIDPHWWSVLYNLD
jgi:hypothetical protein